MRVSSNILPIVLAAALAAVSTPAALAYDRRRYCHMSSRYNLYRDGGPRETRAQITWGFSQVLRAFRDVYTHVGDKKFNIDSVRMLYFTSLSNLEGYTRGGGRHLEGAAYEGENVTQAFHHKAFNEADFDPHFLDMDALVDFHRFDGEGLDLSAIADADETEEENGWDRRGLRGGAGCETADDATNDDDDGRALQGAGRGLDYTARFAGDIYCNNCVPRDTNYYTYTHNGNTPAYLHDRWEGAWCERMNQKARFNSDFRIFKGARACDIYIFGCQDFVNRRLEGEEGGDEAAAMDEGMMEIPDAMLDSYHASLANNPEKAAAAEAIEAEFQAEMGAAASGVGN